MKLVNPFGRSVNSELYTDSGVEPMACMCSGSSAYASARGIDKCFKCGCTCSSATLVLETLNELFGQLENQVRLNNRVFSVKVI